MLTIIMWGGFIAFVLLLLLLDLGFINRNPHRISVKEAILSSSGYIFLAMTFNLGVYHFMGQQAGLEFFTGYLIEKSLSIDNIFVFSLIFIQFKVPLQFQHRVLFWGILGAIVMRAVLILLGAQLLASFHWMIYVFGGFLLFTSIKMLTMIDRPEDFTQNKVVLWIKKFYPVTEEATSQSFFALINGRRALTPLFIALVMIEFSDLVFALDSIPAIFAITKNPFIVYTTNIFAILGLRSLYFVLADMISRFHYLKHGLSLILMLVGAKMLINAYFDESMIDTGYTLLATLGLILGAIGFSIFASRKKTLH